MIMSQSNKDIKSNVKSITKNCIESIKQEFKELNTIILNDVKP